MKTRPGTSATLGDHEVRVQHVGRRKQGGAWVGVLLVRFADSRAPRRLLASQLRLIRRY